MSGGVFINYRSVDGRGHAALLYLELRRIFGADSVFLDSESIPAGSNFQQLLLSHVRSSKVVLALIGPRWLPALRRRKRCANDWPVVELIAAFEAGVRVIPVLIEGARIPRISKLPPGTEQLAQLQCRRLRLQEISGDVGRLVRDLTALAEGGG